MTNPPAGAPHDRFGGSGPYERSTIAVVGVDVACDRVLQMVYGIEGSASDPAARDGGEEALDGVEPGGRCPTLAVEMEASPRPLCVVAELPVGSTPAKFNVIL